MKFGEFEAEIQPEEVKRVTQQAEKSLPPPQPTGGSNFSVDNRY